jgi:hypothetical protein
MADDPELKNSPAALEPAAILRQMLFRGAIFGPAFFGAIALLGLRTPTGLASVVCTMVFFGLATAPLTIVELGARRFSPSRLRDLVTFFAGFVAGIAGVGLAQLQSVFTESTLVKHRSLAEAWGDVARAVQVDFVEGGDATHPILLACGIVFGAIAVARSRGLESTGQLATAMGSAWVAILFFMAAGPDLGEGLFLLGPVAFAGAVLLALSGTLAESLEAQWFQAASSGKRLESSSQP